MTPWRRSFPPIDLRPLALAAGLLANAAQAQSTPAELALSATNPNVASTAPAITPAPNSGQNRSSQREAGSAWRAITGRKVAVTM